MKKGLSRRKRMIGLLGLAALFMLGVAAVGMAARATGVHLGPNASRMAELDVEWAARHEWSRGEHMPAVTVDSDHGGPADHDWHRDHSRHGEGFRHRPHHRSFSLLGVLFGGLFQLAVLSLAGYGVYSLYRRWAHNQATAPRARVINEEDDFDDEIKVG